MMETTTYFLESSACFAVSYLVYLFFFKKLTFFTVNRFYLLGAVICSLILPLIHLSVHTELRPVLIEPVKPLLIANFIEGNEQIDVNAGTSFNYLSLLYSAYILVSGVLLLRFCFGIGRMIYQARYQGKKEGGLYVVTGPKVVNASFFGILFFDQDTFNSHDVVQVKAHEEVHIGLYHSADRLFLALVKIVFWANPFVYLMDKAIAEVHEFEVDSYLKNQYDAKAYAGLLLRLATRGTVPMVNHFSALSVKKRIHMLFQKSSARGAICRYALIAPFILVGLYSFSVPAASVSKSVVKKPFVVIIDAGHGGDQSGVVSQSGYKEKDLNLQIADQISKVAKERNIQVLLTRSGDEHVSLTDRVKLKGDAFISIHCNSTTDQNMQGMQLVLGRGANDPRSVTLVSSLKMELGKLAKLQGVPLIAATGKQHILVLDKNPAPAVLLETGYMTNKADLANLISESYQHQIAVSIVNALVNYSEAR